MPAAIPRRDEDREWRSEIVLEFATRFSGTMGYNWRSRSSAFIVTVLSESCERVILWLWVVVAVGRDAQSRRLSLATRPRQRRRLINFVAVVA